MPQFNVRVFQSKGGFRVVVDSLLHLDVADEGDIDKAVRAAILDRLRASYPSLRWPERYPDVIRTLYYDLELVEVRPNEVP
jgi:hypothetical protein